MAREYKQTAQVKHIYAEIQRYLEAMRVAGKTPGTIWIKKKDYEKLLADQNKLNKSMCPDSKPLTKVPDYNDIPIDIYR